MKITIILLLLYFSSLVVTEEENASKDLELATRDLDVNDGDEGDDLERKHKKKKKKHQQSSNPCGFGRTFLGDKFFGQPEYTYINAPVMNYFFACNPVVPQYAPVHQIPVYSIQMPQHHGHGHGGHGGHGHGGHGGHGFNQFGYNMPYQQNGYQQQYQQYQPQQQYQQFQSGYQRPFQSAVSAAASGFGTALADYFTRPRKAQRVSEGCGKFQSQEQIIKGQDMENGKEAMFDDAHVVHHPTSYGDTILHLFRGNIGSGLLAMGDAFKNGGIVFAPIMTAILGVICVHSQHLLLNCSEEMYRQTKRDKPPGFADTVHLVFANGPGRLRPLAPTMKYLVNTFLCITQLGFCCVYIVFIANNVKMICDQFNIHIDLSVHMIFVIIPVLLACMVRNLKYLTPFSTIANVLMAVGVSVVVYEATQDLPPVETRTYLASWQQLPLYFGTAVYAFEGIGLVLPLKNEMRRPELFQKPLGVLNVGMTFVAGIFITVGFLGYLKWGDDVQGSLTLNLQPGNVLSTVVQCLIALAILFTYPLQFYVPVEITWPKLRESKCCKKFAPASPIAKELLYRAVLVLITFALAETIPQLGLFISLVGAVSSTALALMFPPIIELVSTSQKAGGIPLYMVFKNCIIIVLGLFVFVTGTYESIASIVKAFQAKE